MNSERILIVEDEKIIAFDLQRRLQNFGYEVVGICGEGTEAIASAGKLQPDLILMDIMLEGSVDGIEASIQIQKNLGIPTVFLTAYSDEKTLERAKAASPMGYILKPFKERDLYTTLDIALYKAQLEKNLREEQRWNSAILNSVNDAIITLDMEEKIHYCNPIAQMILDMSMDNLRGKHPREVFTLVDEESNMPIRFPLGDKNAEASAREIQFHKGILETHSGLNFHVEGRISGLRLANLQIGELLSFRDISSLKILREKVEHQASHDPLSGLANRAEMNRVLTRILESDDHRLKNYSLIYFDMDQFKIINDTCGHLAGDELLRRVAEIIKQHAFEEQVLAARFGGDEFAILLKDLDVSQTMEKAWVLKHSMNDQTFHWKTETFPIKASMGIIAIDGNFQDEKSIWAAADDACYLAKEQGGNKIKVFEGEAQEFLQRRSEMRWISRISEAIKSDQFVLHYQPIRPLFPKSGSKEKWEILIRLKDGEGGIIGPFEFIPAAERYNMMPSIDRWVIRHAMAIFSRLRKKVDPPVFSINLSGESIVDPNFVSFIKHELKKNELEPDHFCFEITETATISNLEKAVEFIQELREIGCTFALDDFGSGLSSFGYLQSLPVDFLKIDGNFIRDLSTDSVNFAMVEALGKISKVMGLSTIAEFVTDESILKSLRELGIDYAQGFYLARPTPLEI